MQAYAGRWVAILKDTDQVVGAGMTGPEALRQGRRNRPKTKLVVRYVPDESGNPLVLSPLLADLERALSRIDQPIYLVGGAVRDALLGRMSHDLDFVVPADGIKTAKRIGDFLRAPAFPLDDERDVGRVVLRRSGTYLDIAAFRAGSLDEDLTDRDFTLNAMALPALARTTAELIDPLNGAEDLEHGRLRLANSNGLKSDPVRILRGVRMSLKYQLEPDAETITAMQEAIVLLNEVSPERVRDELLNILNVNGAEGLRMLHELGLLSAILPRISDLVGVEQSEPHHEPVFNHTLSVLAWLKKLLDGAAQAEWVQLIIEKLEPHLNRPVTGERHGRDLLLLAALYHDVGKAQTQIRDEDGRIRFFKHDVEGAKITEKQLKYFRFSSEAVTHTAAVVRGHMRPLLLSSEPKLTARAKHRFWKKLGTAGLDVCLLSIADHLATYTGPGEPEKWEQFKATIDALLSHWFEVEDPAIKAEPILTGRDLMNGLLMKGGPEIGRLLALIEEAQVSGEVSTAEEALELARQSTTEANTRYQG
ncbi:MAG: HDIG domain-containing metalloprotein [Anaerolineae bacterium]